MPSSTARRCVLERDVLEADAARRRRAARGVRRVARISSGSSMTWKIRSPDAVARWAWPISVPSMRSGITSVGDRAH